jgi:transaldolase
MTNTERLHSLGQSLWLDNLTRELLRDGTLARYIRELSLTGLTSNPTIFDHAIGKTPLYDETIRRAAGAGRSDEEIFFELALEDLGRAAELFRPAFEASGGSDGWVSLEVSPLLAYDTAGTIEQVKALHGRARVPNLFIKIPGTPQGIPAIEECLVAGIPINVTLLFSPDQYLAAANAYLRAVERRFAAGVHRPVRSVASLFVSRWDKAVADKVPAELHNRLGVAIAKCTYRAYRELLASSRWSRLAEAGAPLQRLLWASTGAKDPSVSDVLYVEALVAPDTINTMPDATLLAFADHGRIGDALPADGGDGGAVVARFTSAGIDTGELAERLQREGAQSFSDSWQELLARITAKRGAKAAPRAARVEP